MSYLWENGLGKLKSDFDYVTHTVMAVQVITFDMEMDSTHHLIIPDGTFLGISRVFDTPRWCFDDSVGRRTTNENE